MDIDAVTLPPAVENLTTRYQTVIGERDEYIWKWLYEVFPHICLSSVPGQNTEAARKQKLLLTLFVTLLDDLADLHHDKGTFDQARKIPFPSADSSPDHPDCDREYLEFTQRVWDQFYESLERAPRFDEFERLFYYDFRQAINAMEYSWLLNTFPHVMNMRGSNTYGPHNMVMFSYADIDLMYAPEFDCEDLSALRETVWDAQKLARIGNWVSTWERELHEGDYTAGVVSKTISDGYLTVDELVGDEYSPEELIDQIHDAGIEDQFHDEWARQYAELMGGIPVAESVDLREYVRGMETVYGFHLESRGQK
ncbi:hypothetical protein GJR99_13755 [Haloferax sp. MBLA0078]|uniref:Uncharacterized protein n=2 Tax=Haloferax TaxID=2251 RepID=A0A6A8GAK1_9EURY|nr:hypothetical protein [Haloferax marinum]KAB1198524.1 hypothetical protein Hfx1150_13775 [Haloferax sp. CBA1150]MRW97632.1 hypothetical protein [Haloferax marinum]